LKLLLNITFMGEAYTLS